MSARTLDECTSRLASSPSLRIARVDISLSTRQSDLLGSGTRGRE